MIFPTQRKIQLVEQSVYFFNVRNKLFFFYKKSHKPPGLYRCLPLGRGNILFSHFIFCCISEILY